MSGFQQLNGYSENTYECEETNDFGFNIAIRLLEKGRMVKQRNSKYGYKLVRNMEYGNQEYRIAVVNQSGKILSYTTLNTDQLMAKNWQEMKSLF